MRTNYPCPQCGGDLSVTTWDQNGDVRLACYNFQCNSPIAHKGITILIDSDLMALAYLKLTQVVDAERESQKFQHIRKEKPMKKKREKKQNSIKPPTT